MATLPSTRRASDRAWHIACFGLRIPMVKLTRLNNEVVVINADHLSCVEARPDTTLFLINGEKIIVRESLDEVIARCIEYRRLVRMTDPSTTPAPIEGDPPAIVGVPRRASDYPTRRSQPVRGDR